MSKKCCCHIHVHVLCTLSCVSILCLSTTAAERLESDGRGTLGGACGKKSPLSERGVASDIGSGMGSEFLLM